MTTQAVLPDSPERRVSVAVAICCYTERRWALTLRAIESARRQSVKADYILVVVDHNDALLDQLRAAVTPDVVLMTNSYGRGAGGARNSAALHVDADLVAFLDDDAEADPYWLEELLSSMRTSAVVGAGGTIVPDWSTREPWWFPSEFGWVVGSRWAEGVSAEPFRVRNVWSASMIVDRNSFVESGGFRADFGKVGEQSEPEDTELCLRLRRDTGKDWVFAPKAVVKHHVPAQRETFRYFMGRCRLEGRGKAALAALPDHVGAALSDERTYLRSTLPRGFVRYVGLGMCGDVRQLGRAAALVAGLFYTCASFAFAAGIDHWKRK